MQWTQGGVNCRGSQAKEHTCKSLVRSKTLYHLHVQEKHCRKQKKDIRHVTFKANMCTIYFVTEACFNNINDGLLSSLWSAGRKLKCGRRFLLRKEGHIRTRWILHRSHGYVSAVSTSKLDGGLGLFKLLPPTLSFRLKLGSPIYR